MNILMIGWEIYLFKIANQTNDRAIIQLIHVDRIVADL